MKVSIKRITTAAVAAALTAGGLAACGTDDGSGVVVTKQRSSVHKGTDAHAEAALLRAGRVAQQFREGGSYSAGSAITSYFAGNSGNPREHLAHRDVEPRDTEPTSTKLSHLLEDLP